MMKLISRFFFPLFLVAILFLLISGNLLSRSPFVIALQILALALGIWARRTFQSGQFSTGAETREGQLLRTGPYQFIRHPIYAIVLILLWSSVLGHPSLLTVLVSVIVTGVTIIRLVTEEEFLRERYPDYSEYSRKTKRIIPFIF
jgi:protein-S-isoprenylcysteine O-methyltransferase Ste14